VRELGIEWVCGWGDEVLRMIQRDTFVVFFCKYKKTLI
jgi:hypothetical protein